MLNRYSPRCVGLVLWLVAAACCHPAVARTLLVGPLRDLTTPSEASWRAEDGDTILIDPGSYADCAVWRASHLTIAAAGPGVILRDRVCQYKAIFVTPGDDLTIRGITFIGARAPAHNGAGIRAEGHDLTIIDSHFIDNENGILAAGVADSTIRILDSEFRDNGVCARECAHGIYIGHIALLDVERSRFVEQHIGHHIKSRALRTVLIDDTMIDGPDGTSSYLVDLPNGGDLMLRGCVMEKGRNSDNPRVAVSIGEEGVTNPTRRIAVLDNEFHSDLARPTIFVRNGTEMPAELVGNRVSGSVIMLDGPGTVRP
jgi:hypothetical protein